MSDGTSGRVEYVHKKGISYRGTKKQGDSMRQVLVPKEKWEEIITLTHDILMGGYMGDKNTLE